MTEHNKLMAKYHERLRAAHKQPGAQTPEQSKEQERPKLVNPFKKGPSLADDMLDRDATPKSASNLKTVHNLDSLRGFNSSADFVRFTSEIMPNQAIYNSVSFPVACFLKPLGPSVD